MLKLDVSVTSPPDEGTVREIADSVLKEIDAIDDPEWESADELWIQIYGPGRETDAGACGTAHRLADGGYERVEVREYIF